jgi:ubiquinone/menaquinone biosynthesis C-methylase UbiE
MQTVTRFSDRVENYIKYRPHYPDAAIDHVMQLGRLNNNSVIADIGSGTGISAEPLLQRGCTVIGIEPNDAMRAAAEQLLGSFPKFQSVNGTAEKTTLASASVDAILCAQAFHWFDRPAARNEFQRIAKPGALIALMWNVRLTNTPFLQKYEELLLEYATDYSKVNHENIGEPEIREVLGPDVEVAVFPNEQRFSLEGLKGRLLSSSYVPLEGRARHNELFSGVAELFEQYQQHGQVGLLYETRVWTSRLPS